MTEDIVRIEEGDGDDGCVDDIGDGYNKVEKYVRLIGHAYGKQKALIYRYLPQ